jgi:putative peptidoglycan lipid II flippase
MTAHSESPHTSAIARSAGTISFAVLLSRLLGLVREQVFAGFFGAGYAYDAFVVAFRIPNLLRDLFAEGALSAAFITVFTDYRHKRGPQATWKLASNVITVLLMVVGGITLLGMFFSGSIVSLMSPDFSLIPGKHELTTLMTSIMFPFLLLVSLSAIAMGMLNSLNKFFIPSMASSFFNLGSILSGLLFAYGFSLINRAPITGMALGTLIGGLLQIAIQMPELRRQGFAFSWYLNLHDDGLRRIMQLMLPAVIGLSATQINLFVNTFFASSCVEGSVSWLNYAFRLIFFPIGMVGVSLSMATLPVVSTEASRGNLEELKGAFVATSVLSFLLTVPASAGLIFLARPIVGVIFEHGRFSVHDTLMTSQALAFYSTGLFAYASLKIIVPVFYALNRTRYPVIGSFLTVLLNILFVILMLEPLGHCAIALATSLCVLINFLFLSVALHREVGGYNAAYLLKCFIKIVITSMVMGIIGWWLNKAVMGQVPSNLLGQMCALFIAIAGSLIFYFTCIFYLKINEVDYLWARVVSRLKERRRMRKSAG